MTDAVQKLCLTCGSPLASGAQGDHCPACSVTSPARRALTTMVMTPGGSLREAALVEAPSLPNIEILELLGQGGMGAVFKARQTHLDRIVAVKVVRLDLHGTGVEERFEREARALARLNHPNIVTVHDFGKCGTQHYLIMEYVNGVTLRQAMHHDSLSEEQGIQVVLSVCDALEYAHSAGIIHRDLKPENILIDNHGRVKIADFGLARLVSDQQADLRLTTSGQIMGTLHYMAPEQVEKPTEVDHRADIYALGVIFYEMLTRELPLGRFALPSELRRIDGRLDQVVIKALEKEPRKRFQSATEIREVVQIIRSTPPPHNLRAASNSGPSSPLELDHKPPPAEPFSMETPGKRAAAGPFKVPEAGLKGSDSAVRELGNRTRTHAYAALGLAFVSLWVGLTLDVFSLLVPVFLASLVAGLVFLAQSGRMVRKFVSHNDSTIRAYLKGLKSRGNAYVTAGSILFLIAMLLLPITGFVPAWVLGNVAMPFWTVAASLNLIHRRLKPIAEEKFRV